MYQSDMIVLKVDDSNVLKKMALSEVVRAN